MYGRIREKRKGTSREILIFFIVIIYFICPVIYQTNSNESETPYKPYTFDIDNN